MAGFVINDCFRRRKCPVYYVLLIVACCLLTTCKDADFNQEKKSTEAREPRTVSGNEHVTITGSVVLPSQGALVGQSGIQVRVDGYSDLSTQTDGDGRFTLQVPRVLLGDNYFGIYAVSKQADLPVGLRIAVRAPEDTIQDGIDAGTMALLPFGGVKGELRRYQNNTGLQILTETVGVPGTDFASASDLQGRYHLLLPAGDWQLALGDDGNRESGSGSGSASGSGEGEGEGRVRGDGDGNDFLMRNAVQSRRWLQAPQHVAITQERLSGYAVVNNGDAITGRLQVSLSAFVSDDITHIFIAENAAEATASEGMAIRPTQAFTLADTGSGKKDLWVIFGDANGGQTPAQHLQITYDANVVNDPNLLYTPLAESILKDPNGSAEHWGDVYCWGKAGQGRLGDPNILTDQPTPIAVAFDANAGDRKYSRLTLGGGHACVMGSDGNAYCWGSNLRGQLGIITDELAVRTPRLVAPLAGTRWLNMVAGSTHTCATASDGNVYCWGTDKIGEPVAIEVVSGLPGKLHGFVSSVDYNCALTGEGSAWCWGSNEHGRLGFSSDLDWVLQPQRVVQGEIPMGVALTSLAVGESGACAVGSDGHVYCWGRKVGKSAKPADYLPRRIDVAVLDDQEGAMVTVGVGRYHYCALAVNGHMGCQGGSTTQAIEYNAPLTLVLSAIEGPAMSFKKLVVGSYGQCGLTLEQEWFCWGEKELELPLEAQLDSAFPTAIASLPKNLVFDQIALGRDFGCGIAVANP